MFQRSQGLRTLNKMVTKINYSCYNNVLRRSREIGLKERHKLIFDDERNFSSSSGKDYI